MMPNQTVMGTTQPIMSSTQPIMGNTQLIMGNTQPIMGAQPMMPPAIPPMKPAVPDLISGVKPQSLIDTQPLASQPMMSQGFNQPLMGGSTMSMNSVMSTSQSAHSQPMMPPVQPIMGATQSIMGTTQPIMPSSQIGSLIPQSPPHVPMGTPLASLISSPPKPMVVAGTMPQPVTSTPIMALSKPGKWKPSPRLNGSSFFVTCLSYLTLIRACDYVL